MHCHNHGCEHKDLRYCGHCGVVYCKNCSKEWREYASQWTYTYAYPWYNHSYGGATYQSPTNLKSTQFIGAMSSAKMANGVALTTICKHGE